MLIATMAIHALLWLLLLLYLSLFVPRLAKTLRDFNMRLPDATAWMLALSSWMVTYFYLVPVVFLLALALDAGVVLLLRRVTVWSWPGYLWAGLVTLATLIVVAVVLVASYLPLIKLHEGLSK
jgi:type II secretory pathway component PulF